MRRLLPYTGMPSLAPHPSAFYALITLPLISVLGRGAFGLIRAFLGSRLPSTFLFPVVHLGVRQSPRLLLVSVLGFRLTPP